MLGPHPDDESISLADLAEAFADEGLSFPVGLRRVVVTLIRDTHYDLDLTLELALFGIDEAPIFSRVFTGNIHLRCLDAVEQDGRISTGFILGLFDRSFLKTMAGCGLDIEYNPDWRTSATISPAQHHQLTLFPEEQ